MGTILNPGNDKVYSSMLVYTIALESEKRIN